LPGARLNDPIPCRGPAPCRSLNQLRREIRVEELKVKAKTIQDKKDGKVR
jgi:hypothetical protein